MSNKKSGVSGKRCTNYVYLDNNGTTLPAECVIKKYNEWVKCYNASTDSAIAKPAKKAFMQATDDILAHCGVSTATHTAVFTSGATESNCLIIRSCVKAFKKKIIERELDLLPHVIASAIEHPSIMDCLHDLEESGDAEVSYIRPSIYGNIVPQDVETEIKPNTCLVTIMYANNEIPVINNIREIAKITHRNKVPIHSDCVQIFGKYKIDVKKDDIDAISASAHKFYGIKGNGILIINNKLIEGYGLTGEVNGSQQHGLRGGTLNVPGIVATLKAVEYTFNKRKEKTKKLYELRQYLLQSLKQKFVFANYENYVIPDEKHEPLDLELVSLGPNERDIGFILPNTVLLSICKNKGRPFCNVELKKYLDRKKIVVSIGSACSTDKTKASHVLDAIGAPDVIKRGVIRISFGDTNSKKDVNQFIVEFEKAIKTQCKDIIIPKPDTVKTATT